MKRPCDPCCSIVSGVVLLVSLTGVLACTKTRELEGVAVWAPGAPAFMPTPSWPLGDHGHPPDLPPGSLVHPLGGGAFLVNPLEGPKAWFVVTATSSEPSPPIPDVGRVVSAARLKDGRMAVGAGTHGPKLWLEKHDGTGFAPSPRVVFDAAFLVATGDRFLLFTDSPYAIALFVDPDTGAVSQGPEVGGQVLEAMADDDGRVFVRMRWSEPLFGPALTSSGLWTVFGLAVFLGFVLPLILTEWLWPVRMDD